VSATLLDTQALLWLLDGNAKLSGPAVARIAEPASELWFTPV